MESLLKSRDLERAEDLFMDTPLKYTQLLVEVLLVRAIESKSKDDRLFVESLFERLSKQELTQPTVTASLTRIIGTTARIARAAGLRYE